MDNTFTKIRLGPTPEPLEDTGPPPKMRREITPGCACPEPPETPFPTQTIVHSCAPRIRHLARTQRGHPRPHLIRQNCAICIHPVTHRVGACRLFSACNADTKTRPALKTQGDCQRALERGSRCGRGLGPCAGGLGLSGTGLIPPSNQADPTRWPEIAD